MFFCFWNILLYLINGRLITNWRIVGIQLNNLNIIYIEWVIYYNKYKTELCKLIVFRKLFWVNICR
jgi:hypothetical protein